MTSGSRLSRLRKRAPLATGLLLAALAVPASVGQDAAPATAPPPAPAPAPPLRISNATEAQALVAWYLDKHGPPILTKEVAEFAYNHRPIVVFRARFNYLHPAERAEVATRRLDRALETYGLQPVVVYPTTAGNLLVVGQEPILAILHEDVDADAGETLPEVTAGARDTLDLVVREATEESGAPVLLRAALLTLVGGIVAFLVIFALLRLRSGIADRLARKAEEQMRRASLGELAASGRQKVLGYVDRLLGIAAWTSGLLVAYLWLTFALQRFAYTRPWGERLGQYVLEAFRSVGLAILRGIPDLIVILVIILVARLLTHFLIALFVGIERGTIAAPVTLQETALPTRRILTTLVWIFALILSYPYFPGSGSEAFKGVSVLLGVMISLGSAGVMNQLMGGLVLMYSRALRSGDYVRIGDIEGTVDSLGLLSTRLVTNKREEVTIPNSVVLSGSTKNFSRGGEEGVLTGTSVTIGYDAPWRQVHALLLEAAAGTAGTARPPEPFVLQRSLSDFYVEYELVFRLEHPQRRMLVLAELHARIQDAFNAAGVQIMSPHYEGDPSRPVVVPKERWYSAPAPPPE